MAKLSSRHSIFVKIFECVFGSMRYIYIYISRFFTYNSWMNFRTSRHLNRIKNRNRKFWCPLFVFFTTNSVPGETFQTDWNSRFNLFYRYFTAWKNQKKKKKKKILHLSHLSHVLTTTRVFNNRFVGVKFDLNLSKFSRWGYNIINYRNETLSPLHL